MCFLPQLSSDFWGLISKHWGLIEQLPENVHNSNQSIDIKHCFMTVCGWVGPTFLG